MVFLVKSVQREIYVEDFCYTDIASRIIAIDVSLRLSLPETIQVMSIAKRSGISSDPSSSSDGENLSWDLGLL